MPSKARLQPKSGSWEQVIANSAYQTGLLRAFHSFSGRYELAADGRRQGRLRRVRKAKYVVLGYHRVGTEGVPLYCTLAQEVFAKQMQYIAQYYRVLSVEQMAAELRDPDAQGQGIVVTFDDGYLGTFTEALPVLQKYNIPVTVYLTAGAIESGEISWYDLIFLRFQRADSELELTLGTPRTYRLNSYAARLAAATEAITYLRSISDEERQVWCREFERRIPLGTEEVRGAMMSWNQVRSMQRAGVSFGAHTMTHPVASRLRPEALTREVADSKRLIEQRLGSQVEDFAFPFGKLGECDTGAAPMLGDLGFRTALTAIIGVNAPGADLFRLRRLLVSNDTSIAKFALRLHWLFFHPVDEELELQQSSPGSGLAQETK